MSRNQIGNLTDWDSRISQETCEAVNDYELTIRLPSPNHSEQIERMSVEISDSNVHDVLSARVHCAGFDHGNLWHRAAY